MKKLIETMCPLSKIIIKISALLPFIFIPLLILLLYIWGVPYIKENFRDLLTLSVALPSVGVIVSLLGDLVYRDRFSGKK